MAKRGRPPGRPTQVHTRILERRAEAIRLRVTEGLTIPQIAERLGVTRYTVASDIEACLKKWRDIVKDNAEKLVARELIEIEAVRKTAWSELLRSAKGKQIVTVEKEPGTGKPTKITVRTEPQCADPAYMTKILDCVKQIRELLGLDKPSKVEVTGHNGGPLELDVNSYTDEQLLQVVAGSLQAVALERAANGQGVHGEQAPKVITVDAETVSESKEQGVEDSQDKDEDIFDDLF